MLKKEQTKKNCIQITLVELWTHKILTIIGLILKLFVKSSSLSPLVPSAFTHYLLFQWYPQSNEILSNLSMKCWNSAFSAQGLSVLSLPPKLVQKLVWVHFQLHVWCTIMPKLTALTPLNHVTFWITLLSTFSFLMKLKKKEIERKVPITKLTSLLCLNMWSWPSICWSPLTSIHMFKRRSTKKDILGILDQNKEMCHNSLIDNNILLIHVISQIFI